MRRSVEVLMTRATLVLLAVLAAPSASAAPAAPAAPPWSPVVAGVHGRLIATAAKDPAGHAQVRLELELENTSDSAAPIAIGWGSLSGMVQLTLEDESGKAIEEDHVGGNEISGPPFALQLPVSSTLRVTLSPAAYEYVPAGRTMLRPFSLKAWDLPAKPTKLYLRAKFVPYAGSDAHVGPHAWSGPLELPRVQLP